MIAGLGWFLVALFLWLGWEVFRYFSSRSKQTSWLSEDKTVWMSTSRDFFESSRSWQKRHDYNVARGKLMHSEDSKAEDDHPADSPQGV